jgi:hypothetical protein
MSNLDDSWLYSLVKHAIFDLNDEEKKRVESIKVKQTRQQQEQSNNIGDFVLQHHNRVIALRDNDLFVAVGCQIRVLNLTEFKDSWIEASQEANVKGVDISENWIHSVPYKVSKSFHTHIKHIFMKCISYWIHLKSISILNLCFLIKMVDFYQSVEIVV